MNLQTLIAAQIAAGIAAAESARKLAESKKAVEFYQRQIARREIDLKNAQAAQAAAEAAVNEFKAPAPLPAGTSLAKK